MRLDGKVSASVVVITGGLQVTVLEQLLFMLYAFELFHIVWNHIEGYAG